MPTSPDSPTRSNSGTYAEEPPKDFFNSYAKEMERRSSAWGKAGASDDYLIATLQSMESSRRILVEDAQRMLTLILALFVAVAALIAFAASGQSKNDRLELPIYGAALVLLTTIPLLSKLSYQKVAAAYEFYVASALQASLAHRSRGLHESHQWMARVDRLARSLDIKNQNEPVRPVDFHANLIEEWMRQSGLKEASTQPNLLQVFRPIFALTGVVAIMASYFTTLYGIMGIPIVSQILRDAGWENGCSVLLLTFLAIISIGSFYASLRWNWSWRDTLTIIWRKISSEPKVASRALHGQDRDLKPNVV